MGFNETTNKKGYIPMSDLTTNLDALTQELDEAQNMIDTAKKTFIGNLPLIRSALDRNQLRLDAQRIKVNAAKQYITNRDQ
jgi:hypothetical protein